MVRQKISPSTQNQVLVAPLFLHRLVVRSEAGCLRDVIRARKTKLPAVVMTRGEVKTVLSNFPSDRRLIATLMYGAELRQMDCLHLRVQDTDFSHHKILVRNGKGVKSPFGRSLKEVG